MNNKLLYIYQQLFNQYGKQEWWPADTTEEIIIGAILTQNTNWMNVTKAINNLKAKGLCSLEKLSAAPDERIASLIKPSGYYNVKANRLKNISLLLKGWHPEGLPVKQARDYLLAIKGIGEETADSILLYAFHIPEFVIDTYTIRLFKRLALLPEKVNYSSAQNLFLENLPRNPGLFNEYHALIVEHGKTHCKKKPVCIGCPVRSICSVDQNSIKQ